MDAPIDLPLQKTGGFEYAKVFGNGRERHAKGFGQFRNHGLSLREPRENRSARRIRERAKGRV